jgi:hypothetical protein
LPPEPDVVPLVSKVSAAVAGSNVAIVSVLKTGAGTAGIASHDDGSALGVTPKRSQ